MNTNLLDDSKTNRELKQAIEGILHDRPVGYHPLVARAVGSVTAGIFLSQLLYWAPRSQDPDGWVWKTRDQFFEETALTRYEQETAKRILRRCGVLDEKLKGVPCRMHYRVNLNRLTELLSGSRLTTASPTSWGKSHQLDGGKTANKPAAMPPTTTEITSREFTISNSKLDTSESQRHQLDQPLPASSLRDPARGEFTVVGQTLTKKYRAQKPAVHGQDSDAIEACIRDIGRTLGDRASARSSTTRAANIFGYSGFALDRFIAAMYEAQSITKSTGGAPPKNKMAYWFSVLLDLTGVSPTAAKPGDGSAATTSRGPRFDPTGDEHGSQQPQAAQESIGIG